MKAIENFAMPQRWPCGAITTGDFKKQLTSGEMIVGLVVVCDALELFIRRCRRMMNDDAAEGSTLSAATSTITAFSGLRDRMREPRTVEIKSGEAPMAKGLLRSFAPILTPRVIQAIERYLPQSDAPRTPMIHCQSDDVGGYNATVALFHPDYSGDRRMIPLHDICDLLHVIVSAMETVSPTPEESRVPIVLSPLSNQDGGRPTEVSPATLLVSMPFLAIETIDLLAGVHRGWPYILVDTAEGFLSDKECQRAIQSFRETRSRKEDLLRKVEATGRLYSCVFETDLGDSYAITPKGKVFGLDEEEKKDADG